MKTRKLLIALIMILIPMVIGLSIYAYTLYSSQRNAEIISTDNSKTSTTNGDDIREVITDTETQDQETMVEDENLTNNQPRSQTDIENQFKNTLIKNMTGINTQAPIVTTFSGFQPTEYIPVEDFYPSEVTSLTAATTEEIQCTDSYMIESNMDDIANTIVYKTDEDILLADDSIIEFLNNVNPRLKEDKFFYIINIRKCAVGNKGVVYIMNNSIPNVMTGGNGYFVYIEGGTETVVTLAAPTRNPYHRYSLPPVSFTKDNILYVEAGGGDGGFAEKWIAKIDFKNQKAEVIRHCSSSYNYGTEETTGSCSI